MKKSFHSVLSLFATGLILLCLISCDNMAKETILSSIYISQMPSKVYYAYDDPLDLTGLEVTACYSNGSERVVDGWTSLPKPWTKLKASGTVTVTITYEGKITDFTITVVAEGENIPEQPKESIYTSGSEAPGVISKLNKAGDNIIHVVGNVTSDNFASINEALKAVTVGVTLDFSEATFATIPENAFKDCKMLWGIVIPAGVGTIGNFAFNGCVGLKTLTIEDGDEPLVLGYKLKYKQYYNDGAGLFHDCPLESLYLGRNIEYINYSDKSSNAPFKDYGYSAFAYIKSTLSVEIGPKVKSVQIYSFYGCEGLSKVTMSNSGLISSIESFAFCSCTNLVEINIPSTVSKIGSNAFNGCKKLKSIVIPSSVTSIENYAFNGCSGLNILTIEDGDEPLLLGYNLLYKQYYNDGKGLFRDCLLKSIYLGRNIEYADYSDKSTDAPFRDYGYSAFANTTPLSVEIGPKVINIQPYSFYGCEGLSTVTINNSAKIKSIGHNAFHDCTNLTEINIPSNVTTIEYSAFQNCTSLTNINIPSSVTKIESSVFNGCKVLKEIVIPSSVTSIGNYTFNECTGLKKLTLEDGDEPLTLGYNLLYKQYYNDGEGLFRDCRLESLYLGRNIEYADYNDKEGGASFKTYGYSAFTDIQTLTTVTINVPEGVTSFLIGKYAFKGCTGITSATFTPSTNWYNSSSSSMSGGTAVSVSDENEAVNVLKSMGENYLYWKK